MRGKFGYKTAWFVLLLTVLAAFALVAIPVWLIQPFAAQTENNLNHSFLLKTWSPILTVLAAFIAVALTVYLWRNSKRWFARAALILPLALVFIFAWFARQNHFEWMFNPLNETRFASVADTNFVAADDMVLAVKINGEAVAYPVLQMAYHHIAQDVVGGVPITATY